MRSSFFSAVANFLLELAQRLVEDDRYIVQLRPVRVQRPRSQRY